MRKITYFVGIDISKSTFAASIYENSTKPVITEDVITNNLDGFAFFLNWIAKYNVTSSNSIICMEATGVYVEGLSFYLAAKGFQLAIEPPLKVKRAFDPVGHKTDAVDSKQIAEYAFRFFDELKMWQPREEIIERIKQLLVAHEQFTKQKTQVKNAMHAYSKHRVQVELIKKVHQQTLAQLEKHIANIDKELSKIVHQDPTILQKINNLRSMPGCGMLLAANLIVATGSFEQISNYKQLAAFIGIAPYQCQSGTSIVKRARIRCFGPKSIRKLLRLAAQSVAIHDKHFRRYYLRKIAEGKAKPLVLNNIGNKLLKVACAIIRNNQSYIKEHRSIHPMYLQFA